MVGNRLRDYRKAWNLSKGQAAKMLLVSPERYAELESNKYIPNETEIAQMALMLNVTKDYLTAGAYDLRNQGSHKSPLYKTPKGFVCTEKHCAWRINCGKGVYYCPGAGCMKEAVENNIKL